MSPEILHNAIAAIRHLLALARGKRGDRKGGSQ